MHLEKFRLDDRVAVITGGAKGIGRAIADALAEAGAVVVLCDTDRETGANSARDIRTAGGRAEFLFLDVTDGAAVESAASDLFATYGRLDIAVNNAGMCRNAPALEALDADWNGVIDLNLNGVYRCARAFGRHMVARKSGSMVNISSMAGEIIVRPQPQAAYNASKGGVNLLTKSLAMEWVRDNVRVNAVAPGYTATELTLRGRSNPEWFNVWLESTPMGRLGEPHEIASAVLFLVSDAASYITGSVITVDGGYTAW